MEPFRLAVGSVVARRFAIERMAGIGGMGAVYRARDLHSGAPVAVKLLLNDQASASEFERFQREIRALAELRHPAIVAYIAHGLTDAGRPYLVMEWLEGEELGVRLRRRPLDVDLGIRLVMRVSEALAAAHHHGVVHRDIKPSNIFLCDGDVERATLIDFGVARRRHGDPMLTRTGALLGTPEYMAPEQARGDADVGPAADVFSLGCVLFECLTGQPPFSGEHLTAVLTKILFQQAPRLREFRPDLPPEFDELVAAMLAPDPGARVPDGAALLSALRGLPTLVGGDPARPVRHREIGGEQHFFSLVLASDASSLAEVPTLRPTQLADDDGLTRDLLQLGASVETLLDGSLAATFPPTRGFGPDDRAALAVRCALLLKERRPSHIVAVATGRGVLGQGLRRGECIDRAAALLRAPVPAGFIRADPLTAELVAGRFELRDVGEQILAVVGERASLDESRPLLGIPTPCVGREQELGALEAALAACLDEQSARVMLVRAAPGMGKSRLRHEFLRRAMARVPQLDVMFGRADLMRAGAAYGVIASALRLRWGLHAADPPALQRRRLAEAVARELPDAPHFAEFLGELCGVPIAAPSAPLRSARRDPKLMLARQTDALIALLQAALRRAPVLLILEDLHWGDAPSFTLVDAALRSLVDHPLLVVGFARPELDEQFPGLWQARGVQELRLGGLSRRASERLIQHALGPNLDAERIAGLIDQAGGNPLYLEELIRAAASGKQDSLPDTLLAMMHTRLLRFDTGLRRVLRAAASFGEVFWRGGLVHLLADEATPADIDGWLPILREHELVVRHPVSCVPDDDEYAFRHALLREAAYSLSGAEDSAHDHRGAAEFLEQVGDRDPRILAEHWHRAGDRDRAARYLLEAAARSYGACDGAAALALVERGLACEPKGDVRAGLEAVAAWVHTWRLDVARSLASGRAAIEHAEPGGLWWCSAMTGVTNFTLFAGQLDEFAGLVERYLGTTPSPDAEPTYACGAATFVGLYGMLGQREPAWQALQRVQAIGERHPHDSGVQAWLARARSEYHRAVEPDPAAQLAWACAAVEHFIAAGDRRNEFFAEIILGQAEAETGLTAEGEVRLRAALERAEQFDEDYSLTFARLHLAAALAQRDDRTAHDEGAELARRVLQVEGVSPGYTAWAHGILAHILLERRDLSATDRHLELALQAPASNVLRTRLAAATRMCLLLARGRLTEARAAATAERVYLERGCGYVEAPLRLAVAEVMHTTDGPAAGAVELRALLDAIRARARHIEDPRARQRYFTDVAAHARAVALSRAWELVPLSA